MIEINDLFYSYPDEENREKIVLKNISISIKKGDSILLAGNNGSGKTTLLRLINKSLKPLIGKIKIQNEESSLLSQKQINSLISTLNCDTDHYMINDISFIENLYLHTINQNKISPFFGIRKDRKIELIDKIKTFNFEIPIDDIADKKLCELPNFYKHILALLIGIIHSPQILLIDNFFESMDAGDIEYAFPILLKICHSRKFTIIFTTDNPFLINKICSRSIILSNGEIIIDEETSSKINIIDIISMFNHHLEKATKRPTNDKKDINNNPLPKKQEDTKNKEPSKI